MHVKGGEGAGQEWAGLPRGRGNERQGEDRQSQVSSFQRRGRNTHPAVLDEGPSGPGLCKQAEMERWRSGELRMFCLPTGGSEPRCWFKRPFSTAKKTGSLRKMRKSPGPEQGKMTNLEPLVGTKSKTSVQKYEGNLGESGEVLTKSCCHPVNRYKHIRTNPIMNSYNAPTKNVKGGKNR